MCACVLQRKKILSRGQFEPQLYSRTDGVSSKGLVGLVILSVPRKKKKNRLNVWIQR